jgi:hypothetical protein
MAIGGNPLQDETNPTVGQPSTHRQVAHYTWFIWWSGNSAVVVGMLLL